MEPRACDGCGVDYEPKNRRQRFHSAECREASRRMASLTLGPNGRALEETVAALATGPEHRALVASARSLAVTVDAYLATGQFDDRAWREYRLALKELREACGDDDPDRFESLVADLRTEVSDT